ncbi:MAG: family 78 glycoside hydrolase catalytic domain [Marinilabiliaceae bacterium]|nr:family 78 glycoside hydrolase catalytic domain [Marinilabiliaceae bacterium]
MQITRLRTEYKYNPQGLDVLKPRLSWIIETDVFNTLQVAYRITAAASPDELNNNISLFWDSGKIHSDQSTHVEYNGSTLKPEQRIYWKVQVWDNHNNQAQSNEEAFFEMGLLNNSEWKADWITTGLHEDTSKSSPCTYLVNQFNISKEIKNARIYASALGLYEISLNGEKIGDEVFTPGWTSYQQRVQYQVFDVTKQIHTGKNAIGAILGDGWYRGYLAWQGNKNTYGDKTSLILQLKITHTDGSESLIVSNDKWKSNTGPIIQSDIYNGEIYDSQLEIEDWNTPGFDLSNWTNARVLNHSKSILVDSVGVPVRVIQTIKPIKKIITPKGEIVFDFGQNIVGWVRFSLQGNRGEGITISHAEILDQEGNFYTANLRGIKCEEKYTFKGTGVETYEPRFTFHGFRYIRISNYKGQVSCDDILGCVVHSDMEPTGTFECSNQLINQLQSNIQWGLRGNFLDVPTDCPQRDERLGWTGDAQVFAPTACFNMNTAPFFTKWMKDFPVEQKKNGNIPWVVPNVIPDGGGTGWSDGFGATGWSDAAVIIPWEIYRSFGDIRILENQYQSMKGWTDFMIHNSTDRYIFDYGFHFGDWLSFAEYYSYNYNAPDYGYAGAHTEKELIATAYFYYTTGLMEKIATLLNKIDDAQKYASIRPKIKEAFKHEFVTQNGRLTSNTQTAYAIALAFAIMPDELRHIAAKRLADDVRYFGHLTTGFLGTPLLCDALTDNGYPDLAYLLLFNDRYPSWLYPVTMGATTIWERWDGIKPDGSFQSTGMNSFNHYAYGAVGKFLYSKVAGLNYDNTTPGYKKINIKPYISDKLDYALASLLSPYGHIKSKWSRNNKGITLEIEIPANTTATIYYPSIKKETITINNKPLKDVTIKNASSIFTVGSGKYTIKEN